MRGEKETDGNFNMHNTYPRFTEAIKYSIMANRDCKTLSIKDSTQFQRC